MTAQPTTPTSTPPFPPPAPQQGPAPAYGPPQPPYGAGLVPPGYPPLPPAPKRSTGKIVGIVAAVLVLLGGLGAAALFVFGPRSVEPESVQQEIVRITQTAVGVVPAACSSLASARSVAARWSGPAISRSVRSASTRASASSAVRRSGRVR